MTVVVRIARASDADQVVQLTAQLGYEVDGSALTARLSRILAQADQRLLVAEAEGRPVGWLHAVIWEFLEMDASVVIAGLVVDRTHRHRGIGRTLMRHAEGWARERRCSFVRLWSSSARTEAHRFYERLGYRKIKTQYAFAKSLASEREEDLMKFIPRIEDQADTV
jgi:GNAT superfamily N-acetyltransferase